MTTYFMSVQREINRMPPLDGVTLYSQIEENVKSGHALLKIRERKLGSQFVAEVPIFKAISDSVKGIFSLRK